jgi:hypothetical protein
MLDSLNGVVVQDDRLKPKPLQHERRFAVEAQTPRAVIA